ncbi:DUF413 domain-containing protein [Alteromonas sediminis]|uniref:Macrodomain Ori protein n=1 Tax=Alteromonas sediminis TaxID=2259342 RepID=A0A3N5YBH1_9ALTE|nr:DUF413 domain-containing protein [Alteromonas sediminis]RPJ66335.1 DUF413 domain-containing protein [Alteromonas sediminis]
MATLTREQLIKRVFADPKNYPYGFARSGDFSINESRALSQYGSLIAALVDGKLTPEMDEDFNYLAVAHGDKEPENIAERAWLKYQKRINRPKAASIYGRTRVTVDEDDDDEISDNSDLTLTISED